MAGGLVLLKLDVIEEYRRREGLSRLDLYDKFGVCPAVGSNILRCRPVSLCVTKRIAAAMGVKVAGIIKSWVGGDEQVTSDA